MCRRTSGKQHCDRVTMLQAPSSLWLPLHDEQPALVHSFSTGSVCALWQPAAAPPVIRRAAAPQDRPTVSAAPQRPPRKPSPGAAAPAAASPSADRRRTAAPSAKDPSLRGQRVPSSPRKHRHKGWKVGMALKIGENANLSTAFTGTRGEMEPKDTLI